MKFVLSFIFSLTILIISIIPCLAVETGYYLENINESVEECNRISEILDLKRIDYEVLDRSISRFDVSEDSLVAIGFQSIGTDYVCIYTNTGDFLYGYSFELDSSFGIEWEDNNVALYLVRSNMLITLDENGNCIRTADIAKTDSNEEYSRNLLNRTEKEVNIQKYVLKNNKGFLGLFSSSYAKLISFDDTGNETIIYDSGMIGWIEPIINIIILAVMIVVVIWWRLKKTRDGPVS